MSEQLESLFCEYFKSFSNMNIFELDNMFDDNVHLTDWNVNLNGRAQVLNFNKTLFNSVNQIEGHIVSLVTSANTVYAELIIKIDNAELNVLDVVKFNNEDKIIKINAYQMNDLPPEVAWEKKLAEIRKRDPFIYK